MSIGLQLILHLLGDYIIQNHAMANYKRTSMAWASLHAITYAMPFAAVLLFTHWGTLAQSMGAITLALAIISGTHALIDRYAPHRKWMEWWGIGQPSTLFERLNIDQPQATAPAFLGVWLGIIVDNTIHLTINALTLWAFDL